MPTKLILIILQYEIDSFPLNMEFTVSDLFIPSQWNCLNPTDKATFALGSIIKYHLTQLLIVLILELKQLLDKKYIKEYNKRALWLFFFSCQGFFDNLFFNNSIFANSLYL